MHVSVFDLFKLGVGPSSSHTMGPMTAAGRFLERLGPDVERTARVETTLYASLALTGRGHATATPETSFTAVVVPEGLTSTRYDAPGTSGVVGVTFIDRNGPVHETAALEAFRQLTAVPRLVVDVDSRIRTF